MHSDPLATDVTRSASQQHAFYLDKNRRWYRETKHSTSLQYQQMLEYFLDSEKLHYDRQRYGSSLEPNEVDVVTWRHSGA